MDLASGVHTAGERRQLEAFLDTCRGTLHDSLDGLTEDEARRRLVPSRTTPLGLVKHAIFVEYVWFAEAVSGTPRTSLGLPESVDDSFALTDSDTIAGVRAAYLDACAESRRVAAGLSLDDVVTGHRRGPLSVRWIHLHMIRELAQHCGHADILREQLLAART
jgi:hypothetical protein